MRQTAMLWLMASLPDTERAPEKVPPCVDWSGIVPTYLSQRPPTFRVSLPTENESCTKKPVTLAAFSEIAGELKMRTDTGTSLL